MKPIKLNVYEGIITIMQRDVTIEIYKFTRVAQLKLENCLIALKNHKNS